MKKLKQLSVFKFLILTVVFFSILSGCQGEDIVNINPVTSTKGIFILYEGAFGQSTSYDYAFIDTERDTVFTNVFQNSNNGALLNSFPDGMLLAGNELFITSQGAYGQPGSIYKINAETNQLINSVNAIGNNPYNLTVANNKIYFTNISSGKVIITDMNLGILTDTVAVGDSPADILSAGNNIFVGKQTYAFERSLSVINQSNQVSKIFLQGPPVALAQNSGKVYISTFGYKKLMVIDVSSALITDSIDIPISQAGIGYLASGSNNEMYVLGTDTAFQYMEGKSIYKINLVSKTVETGFSVNVSGTDVIYGIDYDSAENKLYIAIAKGNNNGEVRIYNTAGTLLKTYPDIGGKYPRRFAFKH